MSKPLIQDNSYDVLVLDLTSVSMLDKLTVIGLLPDPHYFDTASEALVSAAATLKIDAI